MHLLGEYSSYDPLRAALRLIEAQRVPAPHNIMNPQGHDAPAAKTGDHHRF